MVTGLLPLAAIAEANGTSGSGSVANSLQTEIREPLGAT